MRVQGAISRFTWREQGAFIYRFSKIPMQKTKKAIAKRFKVTGTGKVMHRSPNRRHLLSNKSVKQKRRSGQDRSTSPSYSSTVRKAIPHSSRT